MQKKRRSRRWTTPLHVTLVLLYAVANAHISHMAHIAIQPLTYAYTYPSQSVRRAREPEQGESPL